MNNDINSLTENEEHNNHTFWRPILDRLSQLFFRPKYVWFLVHLKGPVIPDPSGQLAELIVYITSTRVDMYSHQILLAEVSSRLHFQMHFPGWTVLH